jgi:hypothetical protein
MAGFEVVVRPMVLPNIRPPSPRVLPPQDDPEQGFAVIGGSGGGLIDLPYTWNFSFTTQAAVQEVKRQFDKERVYQVDDEGNINKGNFVELERLSRIRVETADGPQKILFAEPPELDNVEILDRDITRSAS